jgi:hypothetical protein
MFNLYRIILYYIIKQTKNKLRGFLSACELYRPSYRRLSTKLVQLLRIEKCRVVSAADPYECILNYIFNLYGRFLLIYLLIGCLLKLYRTPYLHLQASCGTRTAGSVPLIWVTNTDLMASKDTVWSDISNSLTFFYNIKQHNSNAESAFSCQLNSIDPHPVKLVRFGAEMYTYVILEAPMNWSLTQLGYALP